MTSDRELAWSWQGWTREVGTVEAEAVATQVVRDMAAPVPMLQRPDAPLAQVALWGLDLPSCEETLLSPSRTY